MSESQYNTHCAIKCQKRILKYNRQQFEHLLHLFFIHYFKNTVTYYFPFMKRPVNKLLFQKLVDLFQSQCSGN